MKTYYGHQGYDDPGPGTQSKVSQIEPQRGENRVLLVFSAENALGNVPAASRLSTGIPGGPPVDRNVYKECDHRDPDGPQVRRKGQDGSCAGAALIDFMKFADQSSHPACGMYRE